MVIIRNGHVIELTDHELTHAYSIIANENDLSCAKTYLNEFVQNYPMDHQGYSFEENYGFTFEDACCKESGHYLLQKIADHFNNHYSVDICAYEQWNTAVWAVLSSLAEAKTEKEYRITYFEHLAYHFTAKGRTPDEAQAEFETRCSRGEIDFSDGTVEDSGIREVKLIT